MAGAALGILGGVVAGPVGATVGAIGGSILDSIIFRDDQTRKLEGPRVSDVGVQLVNEGAPMLRVWGTTRVGGALIWTYKNRANGDRFREVVTVKKESSGGGGKGGGGGEVTTETKTYTYNTDLAVGVAEGPDADIETIWANGKLLWTKLGKAPPARFADIAIYPGDDEQEPDSVIQAQEGTAKTPAFRGLAYFRLQRLQLADFGNSIPQFNARVARSFTLQGFIEDACGLAGIDDVDTTALVNQAMAGYAVAGPQEVRKVLEPVVLAYRILEQQRGSTLAFFHKGSEEVVRLNPGDLAASGSDPSDAGPILEVEDRADFNLPRRVTVNHIDPLRSYQKGSQSYGIDAALDSAQTRTIDMPLAISSYSARTIAATTLRNIHLERRRAKLRLPPEYSHLRENDVVYFVYDGFAYTVRLVTLTTGANGAIEAEGVLHDARPTDLPDGKGDEEEEVDTDLDLNNDNTDTSAGGCAESTPSLPIVTDGELTLVVVDAPALLPEDLENNGFFFGLSDRLVSRWPGANLFIDTEEDGTFTDGVGATDEARTFQLKTDAPSGVAGIFDRANYLELTTYDASLESADDEDAVLRGESMLYVDGELIGFRDVEVVDSSTVRVSHLLRGMFATEDRIKEHAEGTDIAFMDARLERRTEPAGSVGTELWLKPTFAGEDPSEVTPVSFVLTARMAKSLSPGNLTATREPDDDIALSWIRRSKWPGTTFGPSAYRLTQDEAPETYIVSVYEVGNDEPTDEVTVTSSSHTYTSDDQIAVGITPGAALDFEVAQVSLSAGPGVPSRINVP